MDKRKKSSAERVISTKNLKRIEKERVSDMKTGRRAKSAEDAMFDRFMR